MKKSIIIFFLLFSISSIIFTAFRSTSQQKQIPNSPESRKLSEIPCYPKTHRKPIDIKKINVLQKEYLYVIATLKSAPDSKRSARELIFIQDKSRKICELYEPTVNPFTDFLPLEVAVAFKKERWRMTLDAMGVVKFKNLLNTPPEIPNPFYLYKEDVLALSRMGFKPGGKAIIIEKLSDLDDLYDLYEPN